MSEPRGRESGAAFPAPGFAPEPMATVPFSDLPGRHERHFRRRLGNPLFPASVRHLTDEALLDVQRRDHEELVAFMASLRDLVRRAVDLRPNEESQTILDLKTELDRAYEEASGLADDQTGNKEAIRQLIAVIMSTIRAAAGTDEQARRELDTEEDARRLHFQLLAHPLVADVLHPESLISAEELAATLLSAPHEALMAVLDLFDTDQLLLLCRDARALVAARGVLPDAHAEVPARLALMEARLDERLPRGARQG